MENKIKTIFIGTPDFAIPSLKAIINDPDFELSAVITQPDKKVGRDQEIISPPVKVIAKEHEIPVWQPEKIKDITDKITMAEPDLIVVIAYAQILPETILDIPKYGCINIHGSLLPKYRGASCVQAAIRNGDEETGITIMKMDKGLDTGPIIAQSSIPIDYNDTTGTLMEKLSDLAGRVLTNNLKLFVSGELKPADQDNSKSSYVPMLEKNDGLIDWSYSASEIERLVRAMQPWPGAWTMWKDKKIIIKKSSFCDVENDKEVGEVFEFAGSPAVRCGQYSLEMQILQLEGKKETSGQDFIRGYKNLIGSQLG